MCRVGIYGKKAVTEAGKQDEDFSRLDLFHDYGRPPTPAEGLPDYEEYETKISDAWTDVEAYSDRLEQLVRDS